MIQEQQVGIKMTIKEKAIEILEVIIADTEQKLAAWRQELENLKAHVETEASGDPVPPDPTHPPKP